MSYRHSMVCRTEGIQALVPAKWRGLEGSVSVFWDAEGQADAKGYYLSPDPRIVIFFNDVSEQIRIANQAREAVQSFRPMRRAIYVPPGMPMWSRFTAPHRFSHLDLHLHKDRLLKLLTPSIGRSAAMAALQQPVETQDAAPVETLASLLVNELSNPSRHPAFAESLVSGVVTGLMDLSERAEKGSGRLTQAQMNKLASFVTARADCRATVAEMAGVVGLSESWFASAFKQTNGVTPLQWQLGKRIDLAQKLLLTSGLTVADIAIQLGFSDQAHLTKAFRQVIGETPAAWRRMQQVA
ncbi:helix-turn-helix transcriptional regulator [Rhizobium sp. SAFR-030]|uniref:helix-turn-helix transcriptional regulator n=1 Tax=Rhizobium sp. SAFR-030 TaxID=3387277 RepID=UPI003F7EA344